jgi:hypothetical protein
MVRIIAHKREKDWGDYIASIHFPHTIKTICFRQTGVQSVLVSSVTANAISISNHLEILSAMNFSWEIHQCITLRRQTGSPPKDDRIQRETMPFTLRF